MVLSILSRSHLHLQWPVNLISHYLEYQLLSWTCWTVSLMRFLQRSLKLLLLMEDPGGQQHLCARTICVVFAKANLISAPRPHPGQNAGEVHVSYLLTNAVPFKAVQVFVKLCSNPNWQFPAQSLPQLPFLVSKLQNSPHIIENAKHANNYIYVVGLTQMHTWSSLITCLVQFFAIPFPKFKATEVGLRR